VYVVNIENLYLHTEHTNTVLLNAPIKKRNLRNKKEDSKNG